MSFLVVRVKLSFPSKLAGIGRHPPELDLLYHVADGDHGQLRLHGVDHVGHRVGEELIGSSVHLGFIH